MPLMPIETTLHEVERLHSRQPAYCDTGGATSVRVRAAKRNFRIVKRQNNIPVLGVCEYCNAEFAVDPETIGRPKDGHAHIQKQFVAHKCKRPDARQERGADRGERYRIVLSTLGRHLFQSTRDIQIRQNLVVGINIGPAVGRKHNWIDVP